MGHHTPHITATPLVQACTSSCLYTLADLRSSRQVGRAWTSTGIGQDTTRRDSWEVEETCLMPSGKHHHSCSNEGSSSDGELHYSDPSTVNGLCCQITSRTTSFCTFISCHSLCSYLSTCACMHPYMGHCFVKRGGVDFGSECVLYCQAFEIDVEVVPLPLQTGFEGILKGRILHRCICGHRHTFL